LSGVLFCFFHQCTPSPEVLKTVSRRLSYCDFDEVSLPRKPFDKLPNTTNASAKTIAPTTVVIVCVRRSIARITQTPKNEATAFCLFILFSLMVLDA
jgi:hypothetical protein